MLLLLDTHLLLWAAQSPTRLGAGALALITNPANDLLFSAASIWEVAIKTTLGRPDFEFDPNVLRRALVENGYRELPVDSRHAAEVAALPAVHRDPFDRMLVAQARVEGCRLLTVDGKVAAYGSPVELVG
ncbi:MAG: type II toxin-antitoxin system VapC family toxin [Propionibacteriaceae bacterium]|jgi:PIN domain nuclease of toxin-antitoxin system|nr:type II toxin-antitoxin system VapC family toxin [Propionibacteriaceae bacterium]